MVSSHYGGGSYTNSRVIYKIKFLIRYLHMAKLLFTTPNKWNDWQFYLNCDTKLTPWGGVQQVFVWSCEKVSAVCDCFFMKRKQNLADIIMQPCQSKHTRMLSFGLIDLWLSLNIFWILHITHHCLNIATWDWWQGTYQLWFMTQSEQRYVWYMYIYRT